MRPQDIINKALDKAIANGMQWYGHKLIGYHYYEATADYDEHWGLVYDNNEENYTVGRWNIIFNHGFAEALWGDQWQTNLQTMVLSQHPVMEYLIQCISG